MEQHLKIGLLLMMMFIMDGMLKDLRNVKRKKKKMNMEEKIKMMNQKNIMIMMNQMELELLD